MRKALVKVNAALRRRGRAASAIDDAVLLGHLNDGWPVWRIAIHHRISVVEVRQAIGRAVLQSTPDDPAGSPNSPTL